MLNEHAFAKASAMTGAAVYLVAYLGSIGAPGAFRYWFNAQFFGADITALVPALSLGAFVGVLVTIALTGWVFGYLFAWVYNKSK
ncbi:MAG: DUF5676 family membrane protein [Patescibacteria group bacterium]